MNPNDAIRKQILKYFYDRNAAATSRFGKKGSAGKISDVKRELKEKHGLTQQQVNSNLTYLIDQGWIKTFDIEKTIKVSGGTIPSTVTWYEITALGIDKIEGGSEFQTPDRYSGINITAMGENIITLGDGNIVNVSYEHLHKELSTLKNAITESDSLEDGQKLDIAVDIESIKDQLAKPNPNKTIIGHLWSGVEKAATAAGFIDLISKMAPLIANVLPWKS